MVSSKHFQALTQNVLNSFKPKSQCELVREIPFTLLSALLLKTVLLCYKGFVHSQIVINPDAVLRAKSEKSTI